MIYLKASGTSMFPLIKRGDVLCVEDQSADKLNIGDIVLYEVCSRFFAHRVLWRCRDGSLFVKGDMHFSFERVVSEQITGKLSAMIRKNKIRDMAGTGKLVSYMYFLICLPVSLVLDAMISAKMTKSIVRS